MKKLMMFAAAMTIVGGAYAGVCTPGTESSPCDTPVWDFVMKGKTANGIAKGYKAVYSISYKGAIVGNLIENTTDATIIPGMKVETTETIISVTTNTAAYTGSNVTDTAVNSVPVPAELPSPAVGQTIITNVTVTETTTHVVTNGLGEVSTTNGLETVTVKLVVLKGVDNPTTVPGTPTGYCCLKTFTVYLYDKANKDLWVFEEQEVDKMSVFGKGLEKGLKPGGRATLESDVMWRLGVGDAIATEYYDLQFVGFGKAGYRVSKGGTSGTICDPIEIEPCEPSYDWPSWTGWFTGFFEEETADSHDLNCDSECVTVAGGTWSAKLNKKLSNSSDPEAAIYRKFKVAYIFDAE